ncbi:MAG: zinc metalloprotease HtpX, partial [Candidatus Micrarchaeota archaeon]
MAELYDQITWNKRKSYLYMLFFVVLIFGISWFAGYMTGMGSYFSVIAIIIAVVMTVGAYYYSDKVVLSTVNARPAEKK